MVYVSLFLLFFRIGLFSFGGGYAMLPLIYQGVSSLGTMGSEEFARLVALSQVTPGPVAINAATYVGYQSAGVTGAFVATLGVALPSFLLVLLAYHFIDRFRESEGLNGILGGIRPVTIGLLLSAVVVLGQSTLALTMKIEPLHGILFLAILIANGKFKIHPITLTVLSGIVGAFFLR